MDPQHIIFKLQDEYVQGTPDVWNRIQHQIAERVAAQLLQELDGIPSPQGRLFTEIRDSVLPNRWKQGA